MYRVVLACHGVPKDAGADAAADITKEFVDHRTWHQNVQCTWDGALLILQADNDVDESGLALLDEFSDCISAYVEPFDGKLEIVSVTRFESHLPPES